MANLLIEIGNTALKASWSEGMTLGKTFRYQGEKVIDFILSLTAREKAEVMVVASAYDLSLPDIEKMRSECSKLIVLDSAHKEILLAQGLPDWLSYDRAALVMAARWLFKGRGCSVFDLGTTRTVDVTDAAGKYLGGNISLGFRTRFKALNRYSKALPLVDTPLENYPSVEYSKSLNEAPLDSFTGTSVESSIEAGVISGIMFELWGYASFHPENICIFTGGDAVYFAKRMKNSIFVVNNLVLMGLALIANGYNEEGII